METQSQAKPKRLLVKAVVPCWNRPEDARRLLADLAALNPDLRCELSVCLVDNASDESLASIESPPGLDLAHLRLSENVGGSGGFNAGLVAALAESELDDDSTFLWLVDSDARVEPGALGALLDAMEAEPEAVVVGSMLCEPENGEPFELGGRVNRKTGEYVQHVPTGNQLSQPGHPVEVEYVAACSMLVRAEAARRAGLMADLFVNGDDIEWCLRLARVTGGRVFASPASRVRHPRPDRMRTWDRAYVGRNAFAVVDSLDLGARTRFVRAAREVGRALAQTLVGRDDLAALHLGSLADARTGRVCGRSNARFTAFRPLNELASALAAIPGVNAVELVGDVGLDAATRDRLVAEIEATGIRVEEREVTRGAKAAIGALGRLGPCAMASVAIVSARANPADWLAGRALITVCPQGFAISTIGRAERAAAAASLLTRGLGHTLALAARGPGARPDIVWPEQSTAAPDLAVIVLSYNRKDALLRTIDALLRDTFTNIEVLVVDNGSTDGSVRAVGERFDDDRLTALALKDNLGVEAFNRGVAATRAPYVLILDDDAHPGEGVLDRAMAVMQSRPDLAGLALHPMHPKTGKSEWPFAGERVRDDWPVMGCGNLVRRDAWQRVHGYESRFFLYRNDVDLALKFGALGGSRESCQRTGVGVYFDPSLVVWHDSPAAAKKSLRWFEGATRNWVWLCRRHGSRSTAWMGVCMAWAWAHKLAGASPGAHFCVLRGALAGIVLRPPSMPAGSDRTNDRLRTLLRLRLGR